MNNRLLVLDSKGVILKSFSVSCPDNVACLAGTGAVYVTRMDKTAGYFLEKIADWRADTAITSSLMIKKGDGDYGTFGYCDRGSPNQTFISVASTAEGTLVWLAARIGGILLYKDADGVFTEYKNFRKLSHQAFTGLKRMVVDPLTETAYVTASGSLVYKVSDWTGLPAFTPCSTSTGGGVTGYDLAMDPRNRHLFVRTRDNTGPYRGDIQRFTVGRYLTPAPLSKLGTNVVVDSFCQDGSNRLGTADLGIAVAPNGDLASLSKKVFCGSEGGNSLRYYPVRDTASAFRPVAVIPYLSDHPPAGAGVRFDIKGNLYVGLRPPSTAGLPTVITNDPSFSQAVAGIHRYAATGTLDGDLFTGEVPVADKIYNVDFGQIGNLQGQGSNCFCMTAMFGMDAWGRIYAPNGMFQKITVVDNAGNRTLRFGSYGNADDITAEASGAANTAGRCFMTYPFAVDASDDYIYAADPGSVTLVRFEKTFVLDNIPTISSSVAHAAPMKGPPTLSASPDPFNPISRIRIALPEGARVTLEVYNVSGRVVRTLADGTLSSGIHLFQWNGKDASGRTMASGLYIYRLRAGERVLSRKTVLEIN